MGLFDPTQCACAHDMSNRLIESLDVGLSTASQTTFEYEKVFL